MCDPTLMAVASFALQAEAANQSYYAQKNQALQQQEQNRINTTQAIRAAEMQNRGINLRLEQEADAAVDERMATVIEAQKLKARTLASAGEAGVSGLGIDHLVRDIGRTETQNLGTTNTNLANLYMQGQSDKLQVKAQTESRINNLPKPQFPSPAARNLAIAGAAMSSAAMYSTQTDGGNLFADLGNTWSDLGSVGSVA